MPDKLNLLLESVIQECKASKEDIKEIKKDMITKDIFDFELVGINNKFSQMRNKNIKFKNKRTNKTNKYQKIVNILSICFIILISLFVPYMSMTRSNVYQHNYITNILNK